MSEESEDLALDVILVKNTRSGQYGGFKVNLVNRDLTELEKDIVICLACKGILREPVLVKENFKCKSCLEPGELANNSELSIIPLTSRLQIICPFKKDGCTWDDSITKLIEHRRNCLIFLEKYPDCPDTDIKCGFKRYGCEVVTKRKHMKKHEQDHQTNHMKLMDLHIRAKDEAIQNLSSELTAASKQIQDMNKQLKEVEREMKHTSGGVILELLEIKDKMKKNQSYEIKEFYVGLYKFKGKVNPRSGDGNKIGVFVQTQRGKFDDDIIWPFSGKISITLINKTDESHSITHSFRTEGQSAFERNGFSSNGCGYPEFASHETIVKEEYSRGDSIKIKFLIQYDAQHCKSTSNYYPY